MKKHSYTQGVFAWVLSTVLLSSCGSIKTADFTARKYTNFDNKQHASVQFVKPQADLYAGAGVGYLSNKDILLQQPENSNVEELGTKKEDLRIEKKTFTKHVKAKFKAFNNKNMFVKNENEFTSFASDSRSESIVTTSTAIGRKKDASFFLEVILSIFIAPLAVYHYVKYIDSKFWIATLLYVLAVGGVFYIRILAPLAPLAPLSVGLLLMLLPIVYALLIVTHTIK